MRALNHWRLGRGPISELLVFSPGQEPPAEDIEQFVSAARVRLPVLPFQASRYVLRETRQTVSWLTSYIRCEVEELRSNFAREDKSFHLVLLDHLATGDRSVSFRLTTSGISGHTKWRVSLRRVAFEGSEEHFLCAEY